MTQHEVYYEMFFLGLCKGQSMTDSAPLRVLLSMYAFIISINFGEMSWNYESIKSYCLISLLKDYKKV